VNRNIAYIYIYISPSRFHHSVSVILNCCLLFHRLLRNPKLFVIGFNRISTRERTYVTLLGDSQQPIHTNLFGNGPRLEFLLGESDVRLVTRLNNLSTVTGFSSCTHLQIHIYAHLLHSRAVNRSISLYGIILKSVPNLCVSRS